MTWLITTTDTQRRRLWQHLFGRDTLPVLHPRPRWQWLTGRQNEVLAYDLDVQALHPVAVSRLADYVARRADWPYDYAKAVVQGGWPIAAVNCSTVEKEKPVEDIESSPASFLQLPMFARQQVFISGSQSH